MRLIVLFMALALPLARLQAAQLQVLSGGAIAPALSELAAQFSARTGHEVVFRSDTTPELIKLIDAGRPFDLLVAPSDVLEDAAARARVVPGPATAVARAGLGVAIRSGRPRPDISTPDALRQTLLHAQSIATIPASATGVRLLRAFDRLGIGEAMKSRIRVAPTPEDIARSVAAGQADLGVFLTNVLTAPGVEVIGTFPVALQQDVVFTAAIARDAAQAQVARAFLAYLTSPAGVAVFKARGLTPG